MRWAVPAGERGRRSTELRSIWEDAGWALREVINEVGPEYAVVFAPADRRR